MLRGGLSVPSTLSYTELLFLRIARILLTKTDTDILKESKQEWLNNVELLLKSMGTERREEARALLSLRFLKASLVLTSYVSMLEDSSKLALQA